MNYPLVPRLPGDVCRGAGALALPPVVGGCCIGICIRVRVPCTCAATRTRIYTYTRALPPPRRRFQLKSTPGVGPDPVPRSLLSSSTRTVLISPPNRRTCSAMHILPPPPPHPPNHLLDSFAHFFLRDASLSSYMHCVINSIIYNCITYNRICTTA